MLPQALLAVVVGAVSVLAESYRRQAPAGAARPVNSTVYDTGTGALACTSNAVVSKSPTNNGQDNTTLFTFDFDDSLLNQTCQLGLSLTSANGASTSGSNRLQLYTSLQASPACATPGGNISSWPPGNQRDAHIADFDVLVDSPSTLSPVSAAPYVVETPCPVNQTLAYELVGAGDMVTVEFNTLKEGLVMNHR